jgi:hypothetical protein
MLRTASTLLCCAGSFVSQAGAGNPFLDAPNDKPLTATFKGTEWDAEELPISVRVKTTGLATMKWGAVLRISFETVDSKATQKREIQPLHFVVTDDKVFLLNEADMNQEIRKLAEMENAPAFEKGDLRALSHGKQELNEIRRRSRSPRKAIAANIRTAIIPDTSPAWSGKKESV